ncbi:hypothetical protein D3C83_196450 [compost metagenome]
MDAIGHRISRRKQHMERRDPDVGRAIGDLHRPPGIRDASDELLDRRWTRRKIDARILRGRREAARVLELELEHSR